MDFKYINIDKIKLGHIKINNNGNIDIPILYNNDELSIKIPKSKKYFFEIHRFDYKYFNHYLTLGFKKDDEFEEEYKNNREILTNQEESDEFFYFIVELKNKIMRLFFNEFKINKEYLNMLSLNELNLVDHEIDKAIWDEKIYFSYICEIKEIEEEYKLDNNDDIVDNGEERFLVILRRRFHVNKITKNERKSMLMLKCNIIFINKKLENENEKKNIYINWNVI